MSGAVSGTTVPPAQPMRKLIIGSFLGNSLEWYDFFLYGTAAALASILTVSTVVMLLIFLKVSKGKVSIV